MRLKRSLATGATVVIAGLSLVACGGDDDGGGGDGDGDTGSTGETGSSGSEAGDAGDAVDAPTDASTEDFCQVFTDVTADLSGGGSPDEQADAAHAVAESFGDIGTPEDIPDDARNGFEVFVDFLTDVDADDVAAFEESDPDGVASALGVGEDDVADVESFFIYAATACMANMEDLPTGIPS